ncbi:hypothetical protein [Prochlorothrix hollandica]|uniref:DUF2281 domain-containing protein n=1 Tax=Prochlorothrix hollandica PCC 9006 = CALU 1027 TaxID=317619 RepID=A0A0M2PSQ3_PROHO|nr:hypothetical protein [Prochlorothrix hollandica]KKI99555.1 hypothetical protein PROH_06370 [Prochlorothrix hollandica PCC 9006 = CALU 1027]
MTPKEQLLLELEQAPDVVIELVLGWLQSLKELFQRTQEESINWPATPVTPPTQAEESTGSINAQSADDGDLD